MKQRWLAGTGFIIDSLQGAGYSTANGSCLRLGAEHPDLYFIPQHVYVSATRSGEVRVLASPRVPYGQTAHGEARRIAFHNQ